MRVGAAGVQSERLVKLINSLRKSTHPPQRDSKIVPNVCVFWCQLGRTAQFIVRGFVMVLLPQCETELCVRFGRVGLRTDRRLVIFDGYWHLVRSEERRVGKECRS